MQLHVSREAAEVIRARGGRLYLWETAAAGGWVRDRLAFAPPPGVEFTCVTRRGDVSVCIGEDVRARDVVIRTRRWPFSGVRAHVDGRRWGWRGETTGGG